MTGNLWLLLAASGAVVAVFVALSLLADNYNLNNIKSRTVGDGQHGTARWATEQEIRSSYSLVPFRVADWRAGKNLPKAQGLVLGSRDSKKGGVTALVDSDDIHCLMIGASGVGKTAYFLYATPEHAVRKVAYASREELFQSVRKAQQEQAAQAKQSEKADTRKSAQSAMDLYDNGGEQ